jgi:hypothetical protein
MIEVRVGRSALKMWFIALLGVPLVVLGADYLARRRLVGWLGELVYGAKDWDPFEARDTVWAVVFLVIGGILILFGLKELLFPRRMLTADSTGISIVLQGPFRSPTRIEWSQLSGWSYAEVDDAGTILPVLLLDFADRTGIPDNPWAARWADEHTLAVLTGDWDQPVSNLSAALDQFSEGPTLPSG